MTLPQEVLSDEDPMGLFFAAGGIVDQYAEAQTGSDFDLEVWEGGLTPLEFDLAMLVHFMGTWEGSGSFVNEACDWWDDATRIRNCLITFGCAEAAGLFSEAAELSQRILRCYDSDLEVAPEDEARREEINQIANDDVSYEKLANFIRLHFPSRV